MTDNADKLYVVTRRDLSPGYQIVQSCHAVENLCRVYPHVAPAHHAAGDVMVVLAAEDEWQLYVFYQKMTLLGVPNWLFFEPDIGEYTAFAVAPSPYHGYLRDLPLAGSDLKRKFFWNRWGQK